MAFEQCCRAKASVVRVSALADGTLTAQRGHASRRSGAKESKPKATLLYVGNMLLGLAIGGPIFTFNSPSFFFWCGVLWFIFYHNTAVSGGRLDPLGQALITKKNNRFMTRLHPPLPTP